jgi:hypothetical protein
MLKLSLQFFAHKKGVGSTKNGLDSNPDEKQQYAAHGLIYGYYLQLNDMLEDYYDYLDVDVEERAYR